MRYLFFRTMPAPFVALMLIAGLSVSGCGSDPPASARAAGTARTTDGELVEVVAAAFVVGSDPPVGSDGPAGFRPPISQEEARCIAEGTIDRLGADRVRELQIGAWPFYLLGYALSLPIDLPDARGMVDAFIDCTAVWKPMMIVGLTQGTDGLSEATVVCTADALADDIAREIFVIELARPYDDVDVSVPPDLSHLDPVVTALDGCATAAELAALDWN